VQLKAQFPNAARQLWPGTFVNVEVTVRTVKDGLTIPTEAIQQGAKGEFVFVIGAGDTVAVQPVEVEQRDRGVALIAHGLKPGQTVVRQGQYRLVDGTQVAAAPADQVANTTTASAGMLP
jgi:multidrug efflux system membrane fusion protein